MTRVFSGIQPSGEVQLGNYLGAMKHWVTDQHHHDSLYCVVDLHAITLPQDPGDLRRRTIEVGAALLAVGLDPDVCTLFVQSHVPEHTGLAWLLECTASYGELQRMTQFKDKSIKATGGDDGAAIPAALLTYPVLMAADILLYDTDRVPVGDDQRQHLELAHDIAGRFNHRHGDTFVIPEAAIPKAAARVMDLQHPTSKMSKSADSPQGTIRVFDEPAKIAKQIKRAVTDTDNEVRFDPEAKPGVSNLLSILAAVTDGDPEALARGYTQYGPLKSDTADAVIAALAPVQARYTELMADPGEITRTLAVGAAKAATIAGPVLERARDAVGLLPPQ